MFNIEQTTTERENEGTWTDFQGSKLLIASSGSIKFQRMWSRLQRPHHRDIEKRRLDPETQLDLMAKAMAKNVLLDWSDVVGNDGSLVKYSNDLAYKALKGNSELRDFVTDFATDLQNYIEDSKVELGKSVEKSSNGKSSTVSEKSS